MTESVKKVRILHLEDNPFDHELIRRELNVRGFPHAITLAMDRPSYIEALERGDVDLILSDYRVPGFDGDQALALALERRPAVPFIMVTGELGEDRAIETLHRGAWDYVLKDNLKRLVPAIERALEGARLRRERNSAEHALLQSERRFRQLFEANLAGVYVTKLDGTILDCNEAMIRMLGYRDRTEVFQHRSMEFYADPAFRELLVQQLRRDGIVHSREATLLRADGSVLDALGSAVLLVDEVTGEQYIQGVAIDITERKQAEEALRESEARYRQLYEYAPVGIYRTSPDGQILMANPALLRMLGYDSFAELARRNLETEGFAEESPRRHFKELIERDGEVRGFETVWRRKDGSPVFIQENAGVVKGADGRVLYYEGTVEDVTQRKRAEAQLRSRERRFRAMTEKLADVVLLYDVGGVITYISPSVERVLGYSSEEVVGRSMLAFVHPDDHGRIRSAMREKIAHEGRPYTIECRVRAKDGSLRWIVATGRSLLHDPDIGAIVVNFRDTTDERRAQEALRLADERLRLATETTGYGTFDFDPQAPTLICSANAKQHLGLSPEADLTFDLFLRAIHPLDRDRVEQSIQLAMRRGSAASGKYRVEFRTIGIEDGRERWLEARGTVFFDQQGRAVRNIGAMVDITERKRAEEEVDRLKTEG